MSSESEQPFKSLGEQLKTIREKMHESVAEVSGAVEIDETALSDIEKGQKRPTEDILMLLISHFNMQDDEATNLWKLAGYEQPRDGEPVQPRGHNHSDEMPGNRATVLIMAVDPRVIYSDGVAVTANRSGVTLDFTQGANTPQSITTARIGMSREQAESVILALQTALVRSTPRQLSDGNPTSASDKNAQ